MTQDLYYVESGYLTPDSGYYVYTADAESAVSSQATMTVAIGVIRDSSATIDCVASVAAVVSHIHGADLVAFSNAAIATEINVIRATNVALTSVFSAAIDAVRGIYVSAQADSTASIEISNQRVRFTEAAVDAAFSLACDATKIVGGTVVEASGSWTSASSLSASADRFATTSISLYSESSQTTQADRFANANSNLETSCLLNADIIKTTESIINLTTVVSIATDASRTRDVELFEFSEFTPTLLVDIFKNSFAVLDNLATVTADINVNRSAVSLISSQASVSTTATRIRNNTVSASSIATLNATVVGVSNAAAGLPSEITSTTNVIRIRSFVAAFSGAFTPTLSVDIFKNSFAVLDSVATLSAVANARQNAYSAISSTATVSANVSKLTEFWQNDFAYSASTNDQIEDFITDSQGNIYAIGYSTISGVNTSWLIKFNHYGEIVWQKLLTDILVANGASSLAVNADDTVILASPKSGGESLLIKFNSDSTIAWKKSYSQEVAGNITIDNDGNIYSHADLTTGRLTKFDSSGNFVWRKSITLPARDVKPIFDPAGYLYVFGSQYRFAKINLSNFTVVWFKYNVPASGYQNYIYDAVADRDFNIYIVARDATNTSGAYRNYITKYSAAGTHLWSRYTTTGSEFVGIKYDFTNDSIYTYSRDGNVLSISASGSINWQRTFTGSDAATLGSASLAFDLDSQRKGLYITAGRTRIVKLPLNGSGTAASPLTYTSSAVSFTSTSTDPATSTPTITLGNVTWSTGGSSISTSDAGFTAIQYPIENYSFYQDTSASMQSTVSVSAVVSHLKGSFVSLSSSSSVTAVSNTLVSAESAITSTSSLSAVGANTKEINLVAFTNASLTAYNQRTRNLASSQTAQASVSADIRILKVASSDLSSLASLAVDISVVRDASANWQAFASELVVGDRFAPTAVSISSEFTSSVTAVKSVAATSTITSQSTLAATTANSKIGSLSSTQASEFTQTADNIRIRSLASTQTAFASELAVVGKVGQGLIGLDVIATLTANAEVTSGSVAYLDSQTQLTANNLILRLAESALVVTASLTAVAVSPKTFSASLTAVSTVSCTVSKTTGIIALEAGSATLTAGASAIRGIEAHLDVLAFELAVGSRTQTAQATLTATTSVQARVSGSFQFRSAMQGFAAEVAVVDIIHIDAKLTWMIFADDREYSIQVDTRTYSIVEEDRDYSIVNEDREYAVTRELLTTELQGV